MKTSLFLLSMGVGFSSVMLAQGFEIESTPASMHIARAYHNLIPLEGERVLAMGGHTQGFQLTSTAEIYDLSTDQWTLYEVPHPHDFSAFVELNDGKYMFFGGCSSGGGSGNSVNTTFFDPSVDMFSSGPQMNRARTNSNAAKLSDGKVLIVGNWYGTGDSEIYDPTTNSFELLGNPGEERSLALVFPTADGGAFVLGGYDPFGSVQQYSVAELSGIDHTYSLHSTELFEGESGWFTFWNTYHQMADNYRLSDGRYAFMAFKQNANNEYQYAIGLFDPVSKTIEKLMLNQDIPSYEGLASSWSHGINLIVDGVNDIIYVESIRLIDNVYQSRLMAIDALSGTLEIPDGEHAFGYVFSTAAKTFINGQIIAVGGSLTGDNSNLTNAVNLLSPVNTLSTSQTEGAKMLIFPNPVPQEGLLVLDAGRLSVIQATVFNMSGQRILQQRFTSATGQLPVRINGFAKGIYVLQIEHKHGMEVMKFVID